MISARVNGIVVKMEYYSLSFGIQALSDVIRQVIHAVIRQVIHAPEVQRLLKDDA